MDNIHTMADATHRATVTVLTKDLIGPPLDWAVAKIKGLPIKYDPMGFGPGANGGYWIWTDHGADPSIMEKIGGKFSPSTNPSQGQPIMEEYGIGALYRSRTACRPADWFATPDDQDWRESYEGEQFDPAFMVAVHPGSYGPTMLIAGMRCHVATKLGDTVDVPKELL